MCFNIFIRCTNIDMSSDHIIRSCQIYWTVFHPFFMDFASWFFLRPPLPPSLHRPIACATVASQWLSRRHPDHTLTIYGNSLEQNGGFLGLWSFMRLCGHFFESDMISLWLYNYSYVCFPLAFTVHWKYTSYITHNPLRSLSRSHLLQDSCTLTNFLIISNRADTSVARLIDLPGKGFQASHGHDLNAESLRQTMVNDSSVLRSFRNFQNIIRTCGTRLRLQEKCFCCNSFRNSLGLCKICISVAKQVQIRGKWGCIYWRDAF